MNPFESFSHGLVTSKIWLCEELEKAIGNKEFPILNILGCWDNLLAFMLIIRKPKYYKIINGYDLSDESINAANKICDTWLYESTKVVNKVVDVNNITFVDSNEVFINCSVDQFTSNEWYDNIPNGSLMCIQSSDMPIDNGRWEITQSVSSLDELLNKYPMSEHIFSGAHLVEYSNWSYTRFMIIGKK
jgi:hypothetical protein